ncbi:MAG: hypothetical protein IPG80_12055 [Anaerolineales bacterium]|jgi:hypothetical protein|uniref:hypothetical protein n=1 Tax=Candidatus Villigracilis vicinus TaxID=3140679 RepID=UPI0031362C02|nr:hypothetical protein [Anaerolineales bacterium]MBK7449781.1 hypothetical protein [Anaerolineales bacterium]
MIATSFKENVNKVQRPKRKIEPRSAGLNRVFAAAVVNRQFCDMLLKNPREALQKGYLGETFTLTPEEVSLIASIRAETLSDLAKQVFNPPLAAK